MFKSREENGGEVDPRINRGGRPVNERKEFSNRVLRSKAFLEMVRRFKPHQAAAINAAVKIMKTNEASDSNKLKAAALLIAEYRTLLKETYDARYDDEENTPMQEENKPVFSLTMINGDKQDIEE